MMFLVMEPTALIVSYNLQSRHNFIKIVNELGKTTSSLLLAALEKCRGLPVSVTLLSLSVTQMLDPTMEKELRCVMTWKNRERLSAASECNNAKDTIPAIYKSVIGVGELYQM